MNLLYYTIFALLSFGDGESSVTEQHKPLETTGNYQSESLKAAKHQQLDFSISIYPNPATTEINVQFEEKIREGVVSIYNLAGETEKVFAINQVQEFSIPIQLEPGYYILRLTQKKDHKQMRFLVN